MFEQSFVQNRESNKFWTVTLSTLLQLVLLTGAALLPLFFVETLSVHQVADILVLPAVPAPPPPPAPIASITQAPRQFIMGRLEAPSSVPKDILIVSEETAFAGPGVPGGIASEEMPTGAILPFSGPVASAPPPPPPPPAPKPKLLAPEAPVTVGGAVQAARLISGPKPQYPPLAKSARVHGTVRLEAIIDKNGAVRDLKAVSGHPLLVAPALDAVRQWRYRPTLLNGQPVEVITVIDVIFRLQ